MEERRERLITWANFRKTYLDDGLPNAITLPGAPALRLYAEAGGQRIGLRVPCDDVQRILDLRLSEADVRQVVDQGTRCLDLSTTSKALYRSFFELLRDIADRIQVDKNDVTSAVCGAVENLRTLGSRVSMMTPAIQHGLYGELLVLKRLLASSPETPLSSWTGPFRDSHDFRLGTNELEVKTRLGLTRSHTINGFSQLTPTAGRILYLVSILLCTSPDGKTLPTLVKEIEALIPGPDRTTFYQRLEEFCAPSRGYREEDAVLYTERLSLRSAPMLIPIDERLPALSRQAVSIATGESAAARIESISYEVNFEGLGHADGSEEFLRVLPRESE